MRIASFSFFHSGTMKEGTSKAEQSRGEQYNRHTTTTKTCRKRKSKIKTKTKKQKKISVSLCTKKFTSLSFTHYYLNTEPNY